MRGAAVAATTRTETGRMANPTLKTPLAGPANPAGRLRHFPVSFFSVVMGLAGLTTALERAEQVLGLPTGGGAVLLAVTAVTLAAIATLYLAKLMLHPGEVARELAHPVKLSFFPAYSISLLLLSIAVHGTSPGASQALFAIGAPIQLALTLFVLSRWILRTGIEIQHSNPSWFIPVVGNILVPVAAMNHGLPEVSWFFFSVGLVFWIVLLTIILNRVIFHPPLPEKLVPTLFILIAPPAVGSIAWVKMTGELDGFARILYNTALFFGLLVLTMHRRFLGIRFYLSWWAYSFPVAALAIASMLMVQLRGFVFHQAVSWALLAALCAIVALLAVRTVKAVDAREICTEE
jgi:tellurite resistance protein